MQPGDLLFVTEKIVAITQGRSYRLDEIQPRKLALFLSKYVTRTPYGIGLGMPETMEMALRECGTPRILFAAAVSAVTKAFGRRGDFYRIAGDKARAIDGPTKHTIPPYNQAVVLGPKNPREVAARLKTLLGGTAEVAVVDINDIGGNILGSTLDKDGERRLVKILGDNPSARAWSPRRWASSARSDRLRERHGKGPRMLRHPGPFRRCLRSR